MVFVILYSTGFVSEFPDIATGLLENLLFCWILNASFALISHSVTHPSRSSRSSYRVLNKEPTLFRIFVLTSLRQANQREFDAFVCHNDNHWFSVRKIHGKWFNLNSTNAYGPQIISDFYLDVFLGSMKVNSSVLYQAKSQENTYHYYNC